MNHCKKRIKSQQWYKDGWNLLVKIYKKIHNNLLPIKTGYAAIGNLLNCLINDINADPSFNKIQFLLIRDRIETKNSSFYFDSKLDIKYTELNYIYKEWYFAYGIKGDLLGMCKPRDNNYNNYKNGAPPRYDDWSTPAGAYTHNQRHQHNHNNHWNNGHHQYHQYHPYYQYHQQHQQQRQRNHWYGAHQHHHNQYSREQQRNGAHPPPPPPLEKGVISIGIIIVVIHHHHVDEQVEEVMDIIVVVIHNDQVKTNTVIT